MRASIVFIIVTLAEFAVVSLAIPVWTESTGPLAPRSRFCHNAPTVVAGTSFDRRSFIPRDLVHRMDPVTIWCAPGSRTYITVKLTRGEATAKACIFMLAVAMRRVTDQLRSHGDGLLPLGVFIQPDQTGYSELYIVNSNNHQQTWGVAGAALLALHTFLTGLNTAAEGFVGGVTFTIFDGTTEVGQGSMD